MATLRMDVGVAQMSQQSLEQTCNELEMQLQNIKANMSNFQPTWEGNAATQFFQEFESLASKCNSCIEEMRTLSNRLRNEIQEWEQAAGTF